MEIIAEHRHIPPAAQFPKKYCLKLMGQKHSKCNAAENDSVNQSEIQ